jgi:hypothetical protein
VADKLSQEQVLEMMRNGWSCSVSHFGGSWTLQEGKIGHGGATKRPHGQVMNALIKKRLIVSLPYKLASFVTEYALTDRGE